MTTPATCAGASWVRVLATSYIDATRMRSARLHTGVLTASLLLAVVTGARAAPDSRKAEPTGPEATLAPPGEPGDPFEMYGVVYARSGEPVRNTKVFFCHADSKGRYTLTKDSPLHLAGVLRTDDLGRYRIHSRFPGSYGYAAHVHYEILEKPYGQGFVNVRRVGVSSPQAQMSIPVNKDKDGVWRLRKDLLTSERGGVPVRVPELRYPPKTPPDSAR